MDKAFLKPMAKHADKIISGVLKSFAAQFNVPVHKVLVGTTYRDNKILYHFFVDSKKVHQCTTEELFEFKGESVEGEQKSTEQEIHDVLSEILIDVKTP